MGDLGAVDRGHWCSESYCDNLYSFSAQELSINFFRTRELPESISRLSVPQLGEDSLGKGGLR